MGRLLLGGERVMDLTVKQIIDLVGFAGLSVVEKPDEYDLEMEITICTSSNGQKYAYYTEYHEEGSMELG